MEGDNIPRIEQGPFEDLLKPVSFDEVKVALFSMSPCTALGPDGFQPIFHWTYWDTVGHDIWEMVAKIFVTRDINPVLNETLIVSIPKVDQRIRPFLNNLIGPFHNSFIPERGSGDNALIT